jgi:hypothetical protein
MRAHCAAPAAFAAAFFMAGCGGVHTATLQVGVSDPSGKPLTRAQVWVDGTSQRVFTDATGNATLTKLKAGVYQVEAGTGGYFREHRTVTVASKGDPAPVSIELPYAPPRGTFWWQPKSTEWVAISVNSYDPWNAFLNIYQWGCFGGSWYQPVTHQVQLDTANNQLNFDYGKTIQITGPDQLNAAWKRGTDVVSSLPDFATNTEPQGACNGSSAAWDSGNSP